MYVSHDLLTFQLSGKGFIKSYVSGAYLPPQDRLLTQLPTPVDLSSSIQHTHSALYLQIKLYIYIYKQYKNYLYRYIPYRLLLCVVIIDT